MSIPPSIDPRLLATEIEASVAEFNRLVNLAAELGLAVEAELHDQPMAGALAARPIFMVQVVAPL
jgi:hypothetical protein